MADRLLAGEWRVLGLLVDPTTGPTDHPLGTVLHLAAIPDGPGRGETLPRLEHLDGPLALRLRGDLLPAR